MKDVDNWGADCDAEKTASSKETEAYEVIGMGDAADADLPPKEYIWGSMPYSDAPLVVIYGAPGRGKTRLVQCLATAQILGRDFLGLPTLHRPLTWLHVQTENGIHRQQEEARRFLYGDADYNAALTTPDKVDAALARRGLTRSDKERLNKRNLTFKLTKPADRCVSLSDEANVARLVATFRRHRPEVVTWDPWGDVVLEGAELDDGKIRETVRAIVRTEVEAGLGPMPLNVILAHARMGLKEEANAAGGESGNFGKNSKALYSIARYVLNVRRATLDEDPPVEIINAKNNDGKKQPPIAARLNFGIREYERIENFDHEAWQKELEGAAGVQKRSAAFTPSEKEKVWTAIKESLANADGGVLTYIDLRNVAVNDHGVGKSAVEREISSRFSKKELVTTAKMTKGKEGTWARKGNATLYGLPEAIEAYRRNHPTGVKC